MNIHRLVFSEINLAGRRLAKSPGFAAMAIMELGLSCLALASTAFAAGDNGTPESKYPPYVVQGTEVRILPRSQSDRQYQLIIGLPSSFKSEPTKRYPVVFVTDGYYDFTTVLASYFNLVYDKTVPEMIIVGLAYAGEKPDVGRLRQSDLVPEHIDVGAGPAGAPANAGTFLEMIETVAIPLLEREYRADPNHRILMGCSAGGLFTLYALYTKPDLFQGYVAASPSVGSVWQYEDDFSKSGRPVDARVFVTSGQYEWPSYRQMILRFDQLLLTRKYLRGGYKFRSIDRMRHGGEKAESYAQGLQYVCEPIAPEKGIAADNWPTDPAFERFEICFEAVSSIGSESQWTPRVADAIKRHRQLLDELLQQKKVLGASRTPEGGSRTYSDIYLLAKDRTEAERLAAVDPAVVAGAMTYKIISLTGQENASQK